MVLPSTCRCTMRAGQQSAASKLPFAICCGQSSIALNIYEAQYGDENSASEKEGSIRKMPRWVSRCFGVLVDVDT